MSGWALAVGMGMVTYAFKTWDRGAELSDDPKVWITEGVDRSGILGILSEINQLSEFYFQIPQREDLLLEMFFLQYENLVNMNTARTVLLPNTSYTRFCQFRPWMISIYNMIIYTYIYCTQCVPMVSSRTFFAHYI